MSLRYAEHPPSSDLRPWVECYWTSRGRVAGEHRHRVLPDGCMDLLLVFGDRPGPGPGVAGDLAFVVGTQTVAVEVVQEGVADFVGVRFRPGALPAFLPLCAGDAVDRHVALDAVAPPGWRQLHDRLAPRSRSARLTLLDRLLLERLRITAPDRLVARAVRLLTRPDLATATAVADHLGLSRRTLERRFRDAVGVGPATLGRILRFRRAAGEIRSGSAASLASLAARLGYADQPHLTREVRELSGLTPGRLRAT